MSYLEKNIILVSARQNLSPGTTTIRHLETGHKKMILNFQNNSEFRRSKYIKALILSGSFLKNLLDIVLFKTMQHLPLRKASNMQFQQERQVTKQDIRSCL